MDGDNAAMEGGTSNSVPNASEATPLLKNAQFRVSDAGLGLSQQTLISNIGENANQSRKLPQYVASLAASLGALAAGMVLGWTSPAGADGSKLNKEGMYNFILDAAEFSWVSSIMNLGAATICIPIGMLCDMIGRKNAMLVLTIPFIIGWGCVIWPNSVTTLIVGRYILGISGGAFCVTAPMYTAEIADPETRGRLGSYFQLLIVTGILLSYTLGSISSISMFTLSIISAMTPLIFFVVFCFMPETPIYHLMKGNAQMARKSLTWLRGSHYNIEPELAEQREALAEAERNQISFRVAIRSKAAIKGLIIGFGLMFFQQFSGVNAITFYAGSIFAKATGNDAEWPTIVLGVLQVVAVFFGTLIIDRLGRRILLLASGMTMCIASLVLGVYFYMDAHGSSVNEIRWLPLVCICGFVILYSVGLGPIPWMMMGELYSAQIKGVAGSSACLFNWLLSFIVTKFFVNINNEIGIYSTFWIFSTISGFGVIFTFFMVPETKGKTLDEIQILLAGDSVARQQ